ncbi:MAG: cyanophycinase [Tetrasphaera sp.]|nr:cyanophycinase [Tetrasphaera sp.]
MPKSDVKEPTLFIIGGAEDRIGKSSILRLFVRKSGGKKARLVIIPTASSFQAEVAAAYTAVFEAAGAAEITIVNPRSRRAATNPADVAALDEATGIFMSGGSQLRLSQFLPGTPLGAAIHRAYERGAVIGGTSAGASIMSDFMISMGDEGTTTPRQRTSQISAGLGLLKGCIVDQHFAQRSRYGRLMSVIAPSPHLIGIGIDEDTAIIVSRGTEFTVRGRGAAFVLDCRTAYTDAPDARRGAPMLVSGAVVHTLPAGATFDLATVSLREFVEMHADAMVTKAMAKA